MEIRAKSLDSKLEAMVQENDMLRQVMREGFAALNERFDRLLALREKKEPSMQLGANGVGGDNQLNAKINWPQLLKAEVYATSEMQTVLGLTVLQQHSNAPKISESLASSLAVTLMKSGPTSIVQGTFKEIEFRKTTESNPSNQTIPSPVMTMPLAPFPCPSSLPTHLLGWSNSYGGWINQFEFEF
ncbi:unnamed protein product [Linum trigynum]|uniref:Uncharacterized protein n=1 Tax=Linum trigynum TaxID=586398 RepID=A0AAV2E6L3_9ROSI